MARSHSAIRGHIHARIPVYGEKTLETGSSRSRSPGSLQAAVGFPDSGAAVEALMEVAAQAAGSQDESRCENFSAALSAQGSNTF